MVATGYVVGAAFVAARAYVPLHTAHQTPTLLESRLGGILSRAVRGGWTTLGILPWEELFALLIAAAVIGAIVMIPLRESVVWYALSVVGREQVGAAKEVILTFIDEWNVGHAKGEKIRALDIRFTPGKLPLLFGWAVRRER